MRRKSTKKAKSIFIIGDVHGEYHGFAAALIYAKLMNPELEWTGKKNILVQIGDIIDRGLYPLQVDGLLDTLQKNAKKAGGKVIRLIGNHELELLKKDYYITSLPYFQVEEFRDKLIKQIKEGALQAAYHSNGFVITHAGICNNLYEVFKNEIGKITPAKLVKHINQIFKKAVIEQDFTHPIFNITYLRGGPNAYGGIFWEDLRALVQNYDKVPFKQILGHTRLKENFKSKDGKLIVIDIGLHRVLEGTYSYPVIDKNKKLIFKKVA